MVMKRVIGAALLAALVLTGCKSHTIVKVPKEGKIVGKSHVDKWYETVAVPDSSEPGAVRYEQDEHGECWRISFTRDGQLIYTCIPLVEWQAYKVGDEYTYYGE
jgi:hypothetical protein